MDTRTLGAEEGQTQTKATPLLWVLFVLRKDSGALEGYCVDAGDLWWMNTTDKSICEKHRHGIKHDQLLHTMYTINKNLKKIMLFDLNFMSKARLFFRIDRTSWFSYKIHTIFFTMIEFLTHTWQKQRLTDVDFLGSMQILIWRLKKPIADIKGWFLISQTAYNCMYYSNINFSCKMFIFDKK